MKPEAGGPLARRDGEPLFAEPWQAEVMALAQRLVEGGSIAAADWSRTLGEEIRKAAEAGERDEAATYYACVLRALERLALGRGLVNATELAETKQAWIEAYETTPHGRPVVLADRSSPISAPAC